MKRLVFILGLIILFTSCQKEKEKISTATYEGKDLSTEAKIKRDKETKEAHLNLQVNSKWELYAGESVEDIDFSKPLVKGEGAGIFPLEVSDSTRSYFQLVTDEGKAILSETHLPMTGGYNFRDLGGIRTIDGRYVKWGKIFRSDDLSTLTDKDLKYLSSIPIVSVVDFRTEAEINTAPDKLPSSVKNDYICTITPGKLSTDDITKATEEQLIEEMKNMNKLLVTDQSCIAVYRNFFELLQNEKEVPLLFHCSAGKDRTGTGAALILYALGVDEMTVMQNYMMSNTYIADKYAKLVEEFPNMQPLFEVRTEYLQTGIDQMKKDHGSVENYLTNVLNVDIPKFREMYLY